MKLFILFLAVFGVSTAAVLPSGEVLSRNARSLEDDLNDFVALVPTDDILTIVIRYLAEDAEVQAVVAYVLSDDCKALVAEVNAIAEYIAFLDYLQDAGLDVYKWVNMINELLGLETLTASVSISRLVSGRTTTGITGMIAEMKAILPIDEIRALYNEKLESSTDFAHFIAVLSSEEYKAVFATMKNHEQIQYIYNTLASYGLDVAAIVDFVRTLVGW